MDYELRLSQDQVRLIIGALAELPYKMAAPTVTRILEQTDAQEKIAADKQSVA